MSRPSEGVPTVEPFHPKSAAGPCSFGYRTRDYAVSGVYATWFCCRPGNHFRDRIVATFRAALARAHKLQRERRAGSADL